MDHPFPEGTSAAAAIQAALAAETEAMQAVAACRQQAEQILDEAERHASAIAAQTDAHLSDLHKAYNERIRALARITQAVANPSPFAADDPAAAALHRVIVQLAAWLTGEVDRLAPPGSATP
ncbi:MAG: hypothetical protein HQL87_13395 [Magnetococcales bacterium]|nr:hypothetical protein [Magnetococcales bacterium]